MNNIKVILAVDPGREKCGLAVLRRDGEILHREIIPTDKLKGTIDSCLEKYQPDIIIMGNATWSKKLKPVIKNVIGGIPFQLVDEKHTTEQARLRYFEANPPRGIWKIVPITLQVPGEPYDDFAAVIMAENFLKRTISSDHPSK